VTRLLGFIFRNWPLKLAAIVLATLLYAGLVLSQNARVWPGPVQIQPINQPATAFILGTIPDVTNIRYFGPTDAAARLSSAAFTASIDLLGARVDATSPFVTLPVHLIVADPSITIIDYSPHEVTIRLDPIVTRTIPIRVDEGTVPQGLQASPPVVSQETVTATGPQSVVSLIATADARVRIQPSGIDVDQLVDLVAVDGRGEQLQPVELNPSSVRVRIQVGTQITTKTVPITPVVNGTPGSGFEVGATTIDPAVATISGEANLLAGLTSVPTKPVSVDGATATVAQTVALDLPAGLTPAGVSTVKVTVTLHAQAATRDFQAGVIIVGADPGRTYTLGAQTVTVTLGGGLQALDAVDASSFVASIDVSGSSEGSHNITVRVAVPAGTTLISISPSVVTVFVSPLAKPAPPPTSAPTPIPSPTPSLFPFQSPAAPSPSF